VYSKGICYRYGFEALLENTPRGNSKKNKRISFKVAFKLLVPSGTAHVPKHETILTF
jgi:hypothetical protein